MTSRLSAALPLLLLLTRAPALLAEDGALVLRQHVFHDPGSNNMPSHVVLAPAGWTVEGGAWWAGPNHFNILPTQDVKVTAPDGRRVHVGPGVVFSDYLPSPQAAQLGAQRPMEGAADGGLPVMYLPQSMDQWQQLMARLIPEQRPGATNVAVRVAVVPELTQMLRRQLAPVAQMQQQSNLQNERMGLDMRQSIDAAVLAFECAYTQDGAAWNELVILGVTILGNTMQTGTSLRWAVEPNVSYRAPAGQLEAAMPLLMAIAQSVRQTPQWTAMKNDHAAAMNQIAAKGAADRSRIIADSHAEISRIITDGHRQRSEAMDRTHEKFINAIREVDNYTVPGSGEAVQLPSHYSHVYTNGNGEYILSNDANYNPNADQSVNQHDWQTMEAAR